MLAKQFSWNDRWHYLSSNVVKILCFDDLAITVGHASKKIRIFVFIFAALIIGIAVMGVGNLGFVGLVVPNITYKLVKQHRTRILSMAMILGGLLVISAESLSTWFFSPVNIPVGLITTLLDVPYFIYH